MHKAFSLLEVIFTITILSIVAIVGVRVSVQVLEGYVTLSASHASALNSQMVSLQLANRLELAIASTVAIDNNTITWASKDIDGFLTVTPGTKRPAWSGFCDMNATLKTKRITTPGSNLHLLHGTYTLYFLDTNHTTISTTTVSSASVTTFNGTIPNVISERYMLSNTKYTLTYVNTTLSLNNRVLAENISSFTPTLFQNNQGLKFTLCSRKTLSDGKDINTCKTKVVYYD